MVDVTAVLREHELELPGVLPPAREQAVRGEGRRRIRPPANDRIRVIGKPRPQRRRRMEHEQMHITRLREGVEHPEVAAGQAGQAEQREPVRQLDDSRFRGQSRARGGEPLGRARPSDRRAQPPPQLGLPHAVTRKRSAGAVGVLADRPCLDHLRPAQPVAVVELGEVAHGREPADLLLAGLRAAEVCLQRGQPRLVEIAVDDPQQRPDEPLRHPRIAVRVDPGRCGERVTDEAPRERIGDVRADAVGAARGRAEPGRHPLREPPLHAAGRHRDDLRRERIAQRFKQDLGERVGERVGAF